MIRLLVTFAVAFGLIVVGYHHFAAASSRPAAPAGTVPAQEPATGSAPPKLSAVHAQRLMRDQTEWQEAFAAFMGRRCALPATGRSHCAAAYRAWSVPFARLQRDTIAAMRTVAGACRSVLSRAAGLGGQGTGLQTSMRRVQEDVARSRGAGVPDGLIADSGDALDAEGALVKAMMQLSSVCG